MVQDTNRQHEIDRLRLLLQKATGARKALMIEIEAGERGFRIIGTGISAEHELQAMQMMADYVNILLRGAIRFSVSAIDGISSGAWQTDEKGELVALATALAVSADVPAPVPEEPSSVDAVDPQGGITHV